MTEKQYGGSSKFDVKNNSDKTTTSSKKQLSSIKQAKKSINEQSDNNAKESNQMEGYSDYIKAGKIASEVVEYAKTFIKKDLKLLDIAEKLESKIIELGGKPAFPVNLSINEIAAHDTPSWNDERKAFGLLKADIGVHIDGFAADTAISIDLENSKENKELIEAAQLALTNALNLVKSNNNSIRLSNIGSAIEKSIKSKGFTPIQNLSGHSIEKYNLHAGITIPNFENSSEKIIDDGVFAIEPFSTNGLGSVKDGKPSGIYHVQKPGTVRDSFAREILSFIEEEYSTLPFCSRWIYKKFGSRGLLAIRQIEQSGILHHYPQLIEKGNGKVAQAEHTILITDKEKIITTE